MKKLNERVDKQLKRMDSCAKAYFICLFLMVSYLAFIIYLINKN